MLLLYLVVLLGVSGVGRLLLLMHMWCLHRRSAVKHRQDVNKLLFLMKRLTNSNILLFVCIYF